MAVRAMVASFLVLCVVSGALGQAAPASALDQYQAKLKTIDPNSADDHYQLGEFAYKNNLYDLAVKELQAALTLDPDHLKASILIKDARSRAGKITGTQPTGTGREPNAVGTGIPREWLIPDEDIYRIKMEEIRPDEKVPVKFQNGVIERFIKKWRGQRDFKEFGFEDRFRGFVQTNPDRAVDFMRDFDPDDAAMKDDILVREDPKFMVDFKTKVWPILAASCATPACHGSGDPKGGLRLFSGAGRNDRIDYTNYTLIDGLVSGGRRMIDRGNPEVSLLLQFMLPEDLAQFRHPVPITSAVGRRGDPKYITVFDWVSSLHRPPHPDYRLKYKPPLGMKIVGKTEPTLPPSGSSTTTTAPAKP